MQTVAQTASRGKVVSHNAANLAQVLSQGATTMYLETDCFSDNDVVTVGEEDILITSHGTTCTVTRGQNGTSDTDHETGANVRLAACAAGADAPTIRDLVDDSVDDRRLLDAMRSLRVPRHLFKFMYRLLVTHTNAHSEKQPVWRIAGTTFESELVLYQRDQEAFERGGGAI